MHKETVYMFTIKAVELCGKNYFIRDQGSLYSDFTATLKIL